MKEPPMIRVEYSNFAIRPNEGTSTHTDNALDPLESVASLPERHQLPPLVFVKGVPSLVLERSPILRLHEKNPFPRL
ncbi:Hypothetical protein FKW44_018693 [Caligus rogercresseyi]|uniref:Uncharacterized protein n=1 Tax=Caligus rogercresseyi TaxID=217165 RepID=A0A7T8JXW9_CALRO|nr:Hypothetical protein FKW44_018693 [Caligus rogercresseyi]